MQYVDQRLNKWNVLTMRPFLHMNKIQSVLQREVMSIP